jgi:NADH-quinone oxidoreductase subunit M
MAIGVWPQPLIHQMDSGEAHLIQQLAVQKV